LKLLVEFSHPAQVHKFKHTLFGLQRRGVEVLILSRDKDVMLELLDGLSLPHRCISRAQSSRLTSFMELLLREWRVFLCVLQFKPDVLLSAHSIAITHIGWLLRIPRLVHEDTEFGTLQQKLYIPFASKIITSTAYYLDWGKRQTRIPSLEPLAYLHPNYFKPDISRLKTYGLSEKTRYAVVRIVAWQAMHDKGLEGMNTTQLKDVISLLYSIGYEKIILSSEIDLDIELSHKVIQPEPQDLHHALAFSSICLSESITVAGEAAVLGVPTLLVNPLRAGHSLELERYGLIERHNELKNALTRAAKLASDETAIGIWSDARARLLREKSDMTQAFTDIILESINARLRK
jgi:uncharacterized protein